MSETKNINSKTIHTIIGLAIMFGFWLLPEVATITKMGWRILGLFIGTVYLWAMVDSVWPSFLAVIMYAGTGYMTIGEAFSSAFGTTIFWMMLGIMALFSVMTETGLGERISAKLLGLSFLKGHPWRFTVFFFVAECVIANAVGGLPTVFLLWSILVMIKNLCNLEKGHPWLHCMAIGVAMFAAGSEALLPFKNGMLLGMLGMCGDAVGTPDFVKCMIVAFPVVAALISIFVIAMRFIFRVDVSFLKTLDISELQRDLGPMRKNEKAMAIILVALLFVFTVGSIIPATSFLGVIFNQFGGIYGFTFVFLVIASIWRIDGKPLVSFQKAAASIPWGMMMMIAVAMSIGTPLMSDVCGIKAVIVQVLTAILGNGSPVILVAMALFLAVVLTNISNNMVIAFMFCPILIAINEVQPIPLMACLVLLTFSANLAIVLPSASPVAAMLFGHEELVAKGRHIKYAVVFALLGYVVIMLLGYPIATLLLG